jgi:hypothetical protein
MKTEQEQLSQLKHEVAQVVPCHGKRNLRWMAAAAGGLGLSGGFATGGGEPAT